MLNCFGLSMPGCPVSALKSASLINLSSELVNTGEKSVCLTEILLENKGKYTLRSLPLVYTL